MPVAIGSGSVPHGPLPIATGIHYANPNALPPQVTIAPEWVEHHAANPTPSAAYAWSDIVLEASARDVIATGTPRVTVISRQMAIACTAMFDAWAAYDDKAVGTRLGGKLRRPHGEHTV